jgi:hypothetical protein
MALGEPLKLLEKCVLLRRFDVINDSKKYAQQPIASPVPYKLCFLRDVGRAVIIVERLCLLAPKQHLPNEVESVRAAAEAAVNSVELELRLARDRSNRSVVISGVVKDEVTDSVSSVVTTTSAILSPEWAPVSCGSAIGRSCSVPSAA